MGRSESGRRAACRRESDLLWLRRHGLQWLIPPQASVARSVVQACTESTKNRERAGQALRAGVAWAAAN